MKTELYYCAVGGVPVIVPGSRRSSASDASDLAQSLCCGRCERVIVLSAVAAFEPVTTAVRGPIVPERSE